MLASQPSRHAMVSESSSALADVSFRLFCITELLLWKLFSNGAYVQNTFVSVLDAKASAAQY